MAASLDDLGCTHYKRKCALLAPCCNKVYACRICHDDKEIHEIDRKAVKQIKCLGCETLQAVAEVCEKCSVKFGFYSCLVCRLFDDTDRQQYHCDDCGICRVGGRENFFHCTKCNLCLGITLKGSHKCVENSSHSNCPVCLELLHTSRDRQTVLKCGHLIHSSCMTEMLKTWNYACPICSQSMVDMEEIWKSLDEEVQSTPMPEEYQNFNVQVLCRDCHQESRVLFHVIGMKCKECGSYNTCRTADPNGPNEPGNETGPIPADGDLEELEVYHDVNDDDDDEWESVDSDSDASDEIAADTGEGNSTGVARNTENIDKDNSDASSSKTGGNTGKGDS
ncbi:RING finger and CHY zinc finger domain-containing protein 1-like [Lineus longissimus]|uniref:RING finger and CHY zinc finger domain-containing protein 1-like n=1 Tax=Lineus longissimus TaxID=88925 RepID=UPI002B4C9B86